MLNLRSDSQRASDSDSKLWKTVKSDSARRLQRIWKCEIPRSKLTVDSFEREEV